MNDWFSTWFNSPYYHTLYFNRDDIEADRFIRNISRRVTFSKEDNILDLPCGRGRHSFAMAKYFDGCVTGVDISPNSVSYASENYRSPNLHFEVGDMRTFFNKNRYSALFNLFTSFGYFETASENQNLLRHFSSLLKTNGILVLDYLNCFTSLLRLGKSKKKQRHSFDQGSLVFKTTKYRDRERIIKDIEISHQGEIHNFSESLQIIDVQQMLDMLRLSGLEVIDIFGDYQLSPYKKDVSDRMIFWAVKR